MMHPSKRPCHALAAAALLVSAAALAQPLTPSAPANPASVANPATLDYRLRPRELAPGHWVIEGAVDDFGRHNGCNIINTGFIRTGAGVVVVNTGPSRLYGVQQRLAVERVLGDSTGAPEPVVRVLNLNLHPDYFFGNQAWAGVPTQALAGTVAGAKAEGAAYADNLYRLCGDWMKGTESTPAVADIAPQDLRLGSRNLLLRRLSGHTADDLVVFDPDAGVAYVGGLVFMDRVPTTPHADFARWLASLDELERWLTEGRYRWVVPSHGPVHVGLVGLHQTRTWLTWLTNAMQTSAEEGKDLGEVLHSLTVPQAFAHWAAQPAELHRSLTQWYPQYERRALSK
jgi:quinoprotein relay system zinc metallohydrolase 1